MQRREIRIIKSYSSFCRRQGSRLTGLWSMIRHLRSDEGAWDDENVEHLPCWEGEFKIFNLMLYPNQIRRSAGYKKGSVDFFWSDCISPSLGTAHIFWTLTFLLDYLVGISCHIGPLLSSVQQFACFPGVPLKIAYLVYHILQLIIAKLWISMLPDAQHSDWSSS